MIDEEVARTLEVVEAMAELLAERLTPKPKRSRVTRKKRRG